MEIKQVLRLDIYQEEDARSAERKHLNEILDVDNFAERLELV